MWMQDGQKAPPKPSEGQIAEILGLRWGVEIGVGPELPVT